MLDFVVKVFEKFCDNFQLIQWDCPSDPVYFISLLVQLAQTKILQNMFYIYLTISFATIYFLEWKEVLLTDAQHENITLTTAASEATSDNKVEIFSCV